MSVARFVLLSGGLAGLTCIAGYFPTVHFSGPESVRSMIVGCGVSWAALSLGMMPVAWAITSQTAPSVNAVLGATAIRFLVTMALTAPLALSGWLHSTVFVVWVGISYLTLLPLEVIVAVRQLRSISPGVHRGKA